MEGREVSMPIDYGPACLFFQSQAVCWSVEGADMIDDDILSGDGETGDAETGNAETGSGGEEPTVPEKVDGSAVEASSEHQGAERICSSCGAVTVGPYCFSCGQKNDDLRRSLFMLGREFIEDTFAFDGRMWRTLGLLAVSPGIVPTNYAHGHRSKYTPPVRLFLVVSFLFFLLLSVTQTLFIAVDISEFNPAEIESSPVVLNLSDDTTGEETDASGEGAPDECKISANLRFFVRVKDVNDYDKGLWAACSSKILETINAEMDAAQADSDNVEDPLTDEEREQATSIIEKVFAGTNKAIEDPEAFNAAFNNWLPRVVFLMTPVLALILGIFIRGRDALFFDHMVLSIYSHAVAFAIIGVAVVAANLGAPSTGLAAALALFAYFLMSLKRAYGRGWVKTVYTTVMAGFIYLLILMIIVSLIVVRIVMQ